LCPAFTVSFLIADWCGTKKGGDDDLKKLRSEAKRNGAILTFFFLV
jgi:hypothetical protein